MVKSLTKHGNSLALVIEKPILELLGADAETRFNITTDGKVLVLSPIVDLEKKQKVQSALSKVNAKYSNTLKKLAE